VAIDGSQTWWLQYWFFMYYDDPSFLGFGTHEGDIEMIQLRLGPDGHPDAASYSQHRSGLRASWSQLELANDPADGPVPVTYSARGSHANLLRSGTQISDRSFLPDHNDGLGHKVRPQLVTISAAATPWALWPGTWGGTRGTGFFGDIGIAASSPVAMNQHRAWSDPAGFHAACEQADVQPPAGLAVPRVQPGPPAPEISVRAAGPEATVVDYAIPRADDMPTPTKIVVGLTSSGPAEPARTITANLTGSSGTIELPAAPGPHYQIRATTHAEDGTPSDTAVAAL
jgi:hypothetical protein